jgi:hypothetical protein
LKKINNSITIANKHLKDANFVLITFGTSWIYELKKSGKIVSNCHKIPTKEFNRRKLTVEDILKTYTSIINQLKHINPNINIVFTVSPIRHIKDGVTENQLSKSTLLLAIDELVNNFKNVTYFPSYEIMMDDLRDYRFYNDDMTHPSKIAISYIWDKFKHTYIANYVCDTMLKIEKINQSIQHRPFQPESESHQKFLKNILAKIENLENNFNSLNFDNERQEINKFLL